MTLHSSIDGFPIRYDDGTEGFLTYEEMADSEINIPNIYRPIGGFCYEADTFRSMPFGHTPFYIEDWLPHQGRLEIYAPAKTGKTFLAMQLARCIGAGEKFLGQKTEAARVLYLQFELGQEVLQRRFNGTKKEYPNVFVGTTFALALDSKTGQEMLIEAMEAIQPKVLIIDPLYKVMQGDENNVQDVKRVTDFLDALIGTYNCSIILIHHSGKDLSKGGRGSSVLEGYPDSVIEAKRVRSSDGKDYIKLTPKFLRHAALPPDPIEATFKDYEFVTAAALTKEDRIYNYILGLTGVFSPADVADMQGVSSKTVYNVLNDLISTELVVKEARGVYSVVEFDN